MSGTTSGEAWGSKDILFVIAGRPKWGRIWMVWGRFSVNTGGRPPLPLILNSFPVHNSRNSRSTGHPCCVHDPNPQKSILRLEFRARSSEACLHYLRTISKRSTFRVSS